MPPLVTNRSIYCAAIVVLGAFCLHLGVEGLPQILAGAPGMEAFSGSQVWKMAAWLFFGNAALLVASAIKVRGWSLGLLVTLGLNGVVWTFAGLSMGLPVRSLAIWGLSGACFLLLAAAQRRLQANSE
jgi:hypothetical protein